MSVLPIACLTLTHSWCLQRNKERFVVLEDFKSKDKDHLSVKKGEVVYLVSNKKHDKNWRYVCNFTADKLGLVPAKILRKEANNNVEGLFACLFVSFCVFFSPFHF